MKETKPSVRQSAAQDQNKKVNWGKEMKKAGKTTGHVTAKIFAVFFNVLLTILLVGMLVGIIVGSVFLLYIKNEIDPTLDVDVFVSDQNLTTMIYYTDDEGNEIELEDERLYGSENRLWVASGDIPKVVKNAFVCIEDRRFYSHKGVDWLSTGRSALGFLTGSSTRGGSTITQQLVKNLTQEDEVRVQRKIQEIARALYIEKQLSKDQILTLYLNSVYLSRGCYGVQAAAYKYFSKSVSELELDEAACLASIIQSPSYYDPISYPEHNQKRRQEVYNRMLSEGKITQAQHDEVYYKELELHLSQESGEVTSGTTSWFKDALVNEVLADLMEKYEVPRTVAARMLYSEGLSIYTTMDPEMQKQLEEVYLNDANFPTVTGTPLESAAVIMDYDGAVKALVGGRGEKTLSLAYNRATQAYRSPGSSIKPISVYAPALDRGLITYGSVFDDVPVEFNTNNTNPWPKNLPRAYNGLTTVNSAIERSVNTVAVRVLQKLTPEESFRFCREKAGLESLVEKYECVDGSVKTDMALAPLALGAVTVGVTVEDMASAYTMLANDGIHSEGHLYTKIYDHNGNLMIDKSPDEISNIAISAQSSFIMTKMLQNVVRNGTGKTITLQNSVNCAVKTGTAENDVDRWCVGYTPYYVCACWVGYDEPKAINTVANPAVTLWDIAMTKVHQKFLDEGDVKTFKESMNGVVKASYCLDSGKIACDACAKDMRGGRVSAGWFTTATVPQQKCDVHVLVNWDKKTEAVACEDCPEEDVVQVGMIKVTDRDFPIELNVTDAEYVYRDWSPADGLTQSTLYPFFFSLVPKGHYVGITTTARGAYNRFCCEHYVDHSEDTTDEETETTKNGKGKKNTEETTKPKDTGKAEETTVPKETTAVAETTVPEETTAPVQEETTVYEEETTGEADDAEKTDPEQTDADPEDKTPED